MKYTFSILLVSALFLSISTPSLAKGQNFGQTIKEKNQNRLEERDNKPLVNPSSNPQQNRRLRAAEGVIKRLRQGITERFENTLKLRDRIQQRIAKLESGDKPRNLITAKAELKKFNTVKYLADLKLFDAKVEEIKASSAPAKLTPELKELAKTLQEDIKDLRQILAQTLRLVIKSK
ncbi:MAG: hypothetical protein UU09_C0048G0008 [Microgenomates group bacterium GW2011_GWA2_40_6]|nr:MAG: hypothetical protein UU09_C0048G0008 [Microgenomates group bacterium GW2011_GWA2_40_6]